MALATSMPPTCWAVISGDSAPPRLIVGASNARARCAGRIIARHDPDIGAAPPPALAAFDDEIG